MNPTLFTHPGLDPTVLTDALAASGFDVGAPTRIHRTLLDTFDGLLDEAGLRLERLESPSGRRRECELILAEPGSPPAHLRFDGALRFVRDLPPGPFRSRLASLVDVRALLPVLSLTATRTTLTRRDRAGKVLVSLFVDDALTVDDHGPIVPAWVVTVEELTGYAKASDRVQDRLAALGLEELSGHALDLAARVAGVSLGGYRSSPTVALDAHEPALDGYRRVFANLADAIVANHQGTVDDIDPEFLHEFRVAVRRTRSVLGQSKKVVPVAVRDRFREEFKWLGTVTGPSRDLDVYIIEWDSYVAPLGAGTAAALQPVLDQIEAGRETERRAMAEQLRSPRYFALMSAWRAWLDAPAAIDPVLGDPVLGDPVLTEPGARDADRPMAEVAADRIADAQYRVVMNGRRIRVGGPATELHELRKDAKKLRYLLECFGGVLDPKLRKAFVKRLKALQDNLGEHQDSEVHVAQLRTIALELGGGAGAGSSMDADTLLAMGRLTERLERRRIGSADEFADRFADYDTDQTQANLDELLDAAVQG
jgi:CHAD domain-containing protein